MGHGFDDVSINSVNKSVKAKALLFQNWIVFGEIITHPRRYDHEMDRYLPFSQPDSWLIVGLRPGILSRGG
jgi:hypothetical protein